MKKKITDHSLLLVVDIGNTLSSFVVFKDEHVVARKSLATSSVSGRDFLAVFKYFKKKYPLLSLCVVCSVVPKALKMFLSSARTQAGLKVFVVGKDIKVPIKSRYASQQIGQDRLVCAYAAKEIYGAPVIVVDLGTAITCDVISSVGIYEGGIIIPGLRLSAESLFSKTALLPNVQIVRPKSLIGRDTKTSILSGIFYGYGALLDGLIERIREQGKIKPRVVLTGGHAQLMHGFMKQKIDKINKDLVFEGLRLLATKKVL